MPSFTNKQSFDLLLLGPRGEKIRIKHGRTVELPAFFSRYVKPGMLSEGVGVSADKITEMAKKAASRSARNVRTSRAAKVQPPPRKATSVRISKTKVVGRNAQVATAELSKIVGSNRYPISNGVGIGILSYNRPHSLQRLIESIERNSNLSRITVFVADDASDEPELLRYLNQLQDRYVVLRSEERLGVAKNTNRLLACLERFPFKLLLNDDVEILLSGWEEFYSEAMTSTGLHHFCHQQDGVYGGAHGSITAVNGTELRRIHERPQGAVMAFDDLAFKTVGYFNESFGIYGVEHVDWSSRVGASHIQPPGFWDVAGSEEFFRVHPEPSALIDRVKHLRSAKAIQGSIDTSIYVASQAAAKLPHLSCVIPYRDIGRCESIQTIIKNVQGQRFPVIDIAVVEHDSVTRQAFDSVVGHHFIPSSTQFNKSAAFNLGVSKARSKFILLQDADIILPATYCSAIYDKLQSHESCHLGSRVFYLDEQKTKFVNDFGHLRPDFECSRCVGYFEGGSLACTKDAYWRVGGFAEQYVGYGNEDCDFYSRISSLPTWLEDRSFDFIHLDHPRTDGWMECHNRNKLLEAELSKLPMETRIARQFKLIQSKGYF